MLGTPCVWLWVCICVGVCMGGGGYGECSVLKCLAVGVPSVLTRLLAMCCSVLQCVAVCCSVLNSAAVCHMVLQCVAVCCSVLQCVAARLPSMSTRILAPTNTNSDVGRVLQCVASGCSTLRCVAICSSWSQCGSSLCVAVCCSECSINIDATRTTTHCNTRSTQHTIEHCHQY